MTLRVSGLSVHYGDTTAVDDVHLDVAAHETVALLGRSGSGKTSLLLAIAGVVRPTAGGVALGGEEVQNLPTHRRRIGVVFQDFALFPHLTVAGNVGYGIAAAPDRSQRVEGALQQVDLGGFGPRRIDELSGGQAQRVALARTLAARPRALLLDEPLGSLDPALRTSLGTELGMMLGELEIPTIIVTHDTTEAFTLGDRLAVLDSGRIVASGTPQDLWDDPRTEEVARLLGHRGIVAAGEVRALGLRVPDGVLLVPPGAVSLDPEGVDITVVASRFEGPGWITTLAIGDGRVELETEHQAIPGGSIRVRIDPARIRRLRR